MTIAKLSTEEVSKMTPAEELAYLHARKAARAQAREEEAAALELEIARLTERFEEEVGAEGRAWEMLDFRKLGEGVVFVKRPEPTTHKRYLAAVDRAITKEKPIDEADVIAYVTPSVLYPERATFLERVNRCTELAVRCAAACRALIGAKRKDDEGKY